MLSFRKNFFILSLLLFVIEILIALFVKDRFIRPYVGDFLVVILIYCFLRTFLNFSSLTIALVTLIFSFAVEFAQYFKIVNILGLKGNRLAETIIGTGYSNYDLLAYTLGVLVVYYLDRAYRK